jgi:hypothetical protein
MFSQMWFGIIPDYGHSQRHEKMKQQNSEAEVVERLNTWACLPHTGEAVVGNTAFFGHGYLIMFAP